MKQARIAVMSLVSGTAMLAFCTPSIANACEEAVRIVQPSPAQMVASAEKVIEVSPNESARVVLRNFPMIHMSASTEDPVRTRARRVLAIAIVRTNGAADKSYTPAAALEWAVQALRDIDQKRKNDPAVQADLGEALAKTEKGKAEALTILTKLADKDLVGSPHAYAALATLKQEKGDAAGAQAAMTKCKEMSGKNAASTCKLVVAAKA
jgi:hypothetical protein